MGDTTPTMESPSSSATPKKKKKGTSHFKACSKCQRNIAVERLAKHMSTCRAVSNLVECRTCGRKFGPSGITLHEANCIPEIPTFSTRKMSKRRKSMFSGMGGPLENRKHGLRKDEKK